MPAPESEQRVALFLIVNTSGDRCQTERGRDANPRPTHFEGYLIAAQCSRPCSIELKPPDRRTRQPIERAHPAPHFINNEPYPKPLQRVEVGRVSGDEGLLGYSQLQALGRQRSLREEALDVGDEIVVQDVMSQGSE